MNEAFVYQWKNVKTGMSYIGFHMGNIDDGYVSSSTNKDFWNDFWTNRDDWVREVIEEGSKEQMLALENRMLIEVDAANNDTFYNKHNGGFNRSFKSTVQFDLVDQVESRIKNGLIGIVERSVDDIYDLPRKQVRGLTIEHAKVSAIAERIEINSQEDNMKLISPIVVVTNREEGDILLDGNHTIKALFKLRWQTTKVIYVDFVEDLNGSESNLTQLGIVLNRVEDVSTDNTSDDIKRCLAEFHADGVDIQSTEFKEKFSKQAGKSLSSVSATIRHLIDTLETPDNWRTYDSSELNKIAEEIAERNPGVAVHVGVSDKVNDRIGGMIREMSEMQTKRGILVLHHSRPSGAKKFNSVILDSAFEFFDANVKIHVLPTF